MAVRRVCPGAGHVIGSFPSFKMGQLSVPYESTIERDFLFYLEFDPTVVRYAAQPLVIRGTTPDGVPHTYTPDFQVFFTPASDGPAAALVECKPAARVDSAAAQQQLALGRAWAAEHAHEFVVITDTALRAGARLANLKLLWRYRQPPVAPLLLLSCRQLLPPPPVEVPFSEAAAVLATIVASSFGAPILYHLLFHHLLETDLAQPLTATSLVRCADNPH